MEALLTDVDLVLLELRVYIVIMDATCASSVSLPLLLDNYKTLE